MPSVNSKVDYENFDCRNYFIEGLKSKCLKTKPIQKNKLNLKILCIWKILGIYLSRTDPIKYSKTKNSIESVICLLTMFDTT